MAVTDLIRSPTFLIKVVELVISIVIVGLLSGQVIAVGPGFYERVAVVDGTIIGFIIIGILSITGYILGCPMHNNLVLIASAGAFLLFLTSGGIVLDAYTRGGKVIRVVIGGVLALVNGLVYAGDAFVTWKFGVNA